LESDILKFQFLLIKRLEHGGRDQVAN
jgi:hypothetical protein